MIKLIDLEFLEETGLNPFRREEFKKQVEYTRNSLNNIFQNLKECPNCSHRLITCSDGEIYCNTCGFVLL